MSTASNIHEAALAHGRAAEFLDAHWQRVAPCHWKAVHQVGVNEAPYVMRVRLGEGAYDWEVTQDDDLLACGEARTPLQGRALARRAAQDLTATLPPAPIRPLPLREVDPAAAAKARRAIDRQFLPYIALGLLSVNVVFAYYGLAVGTGRVVDLVMALTLLVSGSVLHTFWKSWH